MFSLASNDFVKGAAVAVLAAVFTYLASMFSTPNFDLFAIDWVYIGKVALTAFIAYIAKNFVSDKEGRIAGII